MVTTYIMKLSAYTDNVSGNVPLNSSLARGEIFRHHALVCSLNFEIIALFVSCNELC